MTDLTNEAGELVTVEGIVDRIIYQNEENGYTVCELTIGEAEDLTILGNMPFIRTGETIRAVGRWTIHQTYGKQFAVEAFEKQLPSTESTIMKYLSSRAIKGIGPATAKKIVEKFGVDAFDVIENHSDWLAALPGVTEARAKVISEDFKKQFGIRNVMLFCGDYFGPATSIRIYKRWGSGAVDVIKANPYCLCDEIFGVGFEKADEVARSLGISEDSPDRIKSGLRSVMKNAAAQNGHTYAPIKRVYPAAARYLGVDEELIYKAGEELIKEGALVRCEISQRDCVYLSEYYEAEKYIADKLLLLEKTAQGISDADISKFIDKIELLEGITYAGLQRRAIFGALAKGVTILTGGPGTGKTTVIRAILSIYSDIGHRVALAAPTGRAAKRISEMTGSEAKTLHRLLECESGQDGRHQFRRNENCLLEEEVVIVDESSMIDTLLMEALLRAIKPGGKLILIGDADQLPSVGAGNILNDLIGCGLFETVELTEIFRQASESMIVTNAHMINEGEYPELEAKRGDFFFIARNEDTDIAETVAQLCAVRLPKKYGKEVVQKIQVITPSRKGAAGTEMLNSILQERLNPKSPEKKEKRFRSSIFREGDKVMQIRNNYDIMWEKHGTEGAGIFNGDIGTILDIDHSGESVRIDFDGRIAYYDFMMLDEIEHAYAITIHKSQGSEYPIVIIPAYDFSAKLLTRNLLYTAVTRALKMVIMVGRQDVVRGMVDNNFHKKRYSGLGEMIMNRAYGEDL
ncbi:MAG: ATP-dependent RecD-like DNA helicase [Clostridia bacterium]|nr:ATP-dependent RecD-like DNA helicase [Clostridia bacterium]